jgi:hypothetical protein
MNDQDLSHEHLMAVEGESSKAWLCIKYFYSANAALPRLLGHGHQTHQLTRNALLEANELLVVEYDELRQLSERARYRHGDRNFSDEQVELAKKLCDVIRRSCALVLLA